jgi:protein-S-isoprenylcysteine O-methyltransferase Ste14
MDVREKLFRYRSYTPIPFLLVMVYYTNPTAVSFIIGFIVVVLGESLRLWGVAIAGSETRTTGTVGGTYLITSGPFAYVRNPLYAGNILIYMGIGIMSNALFPWLTLIALVFFFVQYSLIITLEEEYLFAAYGDAYRAYAAAVPRFLPRLTPYRGTMSEQPQVRWSRGLQSERRTLQAITLIVLVVGVRWAVGS